VSSADPTPGNGAKVDPMAGINTSVPHSARIWNYWTGGKDYYPVDQEAGDEFAAVYPGVFDLARSARQFIARVVRYLAGEAGIRQFLDVGTGLPSHDNTHEVAQRVAPESRIVYVDNDPLVLVHARALLTSHPLGATDYVDADLSDPDAILDIAAGKLDFNQPIAIMLMGVFGHIGNPDEDDDRLARSLVDRFKAALPAGGHLAVYDGTNTDPAHVNAIRQYNDSGADPYRLRSPQQIARFLDGLDLVEPGVVQVRQWRPDPGTPAPATEVHAWGGVGRKP
jgi:S-adenosyl methyltransferase